jgi:RHH-type proline utilization regulon transcriptional repressor/proline dehydrogenase/delta 1-pyrroline-5-carboxylate dehydrogenase
MDLIKQQQSLLYKQLLETYHLGNQLEEEQVAFLQKSIDKSGIDIKKVKERSQCYLKNFRESHHQTLIEQFIHQYPLTSKEGASLMQMSEALLRIPDVSTSEKFVHDQFAQFRQGKSVSQWSDKGLHFLADIVVKGTWIAPVVDPILLKALGRAMRVLGKHFVLGETIEQAITSGKPLEEEGFLFSYDMLGEGARSEAQAKRYFDSYLHAIQSIAAGEDEGVDLYHRPNISVKLSALHPSYKLLHYDTVIEELTGRLLTLARAARSRGVVLLIDAEESYRLDLSLCVLDKLFEHPDMQGFDGIGLAVQAYQRRAYAIIDIVADMGRRHGRKIPVRLVKGAYWDTEIKYAQTQGLEHYPVFTSKVHTDISYHACACKMFENRKVIYPLFATHNIASMTLVEQLFGTEKFEFQLLYGMGVGIYHSFVKRRPCRIYAPVGAYKELLPYLIRRLLENNANSSFLNQIVDKETSIESVIEKVFSVEANGKSTLSLPLDIYKDRQNSIGLDYGDVGQLAHYQKSISDFYKTIWKGFSFVDGRAQETKRQDVFSPNNQKDKVGEVAWIEKDAVDAALNSAHDFYQSWQQVTVEERASMLEVAADLLESNRYELSALCMREAGKTLLDVVAEIREAVDFCRYYAKEARGLLATKKMDHTVGETNELSFCGRGVFACISPWNFPIAIFVGQIAASLVSGNVVIAKPSSSTPLVSSAVMQLFYKAGFPKRAIQLLLGSSRLFDAKFFQDPRIAGVAFTGSTGVAHQIGLHLANRQAGIIPLIAETGGQNAMIVDSSALVEQVVDDVMASAFGSAGPRCSALRILYVQEDIAPTLLEHLKGALATWKIGDTKEFSTDMGPVISAAAAREIQGHIARMKRNSEQVACANVAGLDQQGHFVAPHIFLLDSLEHLKKEIFGPVLHVKLFARDAFEDVVQEVNALGYGLTLGLHTRVLSRIDYVRQKAAVGNVYINRPMTGAVVGAQPFGGEKLSGTGPKAGGPNYLLRFVTERTYSTNLMALGGDPQLFV